MIAFQCPSCKTALQAAEEYAGKMIVCPDCQATAQIPSPSAPLIVVPEAQATPVENAIAAAPVTAVLVTSPATGVTTPELVSKTKAPAGRERRRDEEPTSAAAKGMGAGMIVLLVLGVVGCVGISSVAILIALLVPATQKVREAAARTQTMNNLKQIALAEHSYHDAMKRLPSPAIDPFGGPPVELSWRVEILPYIEQAPMFNQFNMQGNWDDPLNRPFLQQRPPVYADVWREGGNKFGDDTRFQYFTGPNTMFPEPRSVVLFRDVTDGLSNTFLVAEAQTAVPWTKPADMAVVPNGALPLPPDQFLVVMGDGSVHFVDRRRANDAALRLLIDPRDGQPIPPGVID
jgi:Protein of unknown function (DUF1559)